jgi:hypothetical protein
VSLLDWTAETRLNSIRLYTGFASIHNVCIRLYVCEHRTSAFGPSYVYLIQPLVSDLVITAEEV